MPNSLTTTGAVAKSKPKPKAMNESRQWEVEGAMRTLMRAEEHKKDKALMRDVKAHAKKQAAAISKVACSKK